ncbi:nucleolar protein 6 [Plutella xylostella]|uniref:nucleolar protein 6 n=1 Tax=Plutella xylostella TaxID=51655 RepID=UPI002032931C|nr:nucleolar protein 6 [Plutella xylostella]
MVKRKAQSSLSEEDGEGDTLLDSSKGSENGVSKDGAKKVRTKSLYRQPTVRELNRLQETETLFNSNLFRLQIEEILEEVKVKEKTVTKFQQWFETLKKHLDNISENSTEYDLSENTLFKELKVKTPVSSSLKKTKCVFKFHKFQEVEIVGSYGLGCPINSKLTVDIQITVPADTYTKNDSINYRYHKKRAAYLAYIASHLKNVDTVEDLKYSWLNGCESMPVLDLKPAGKLGNHVSVRIHLSCEPDAYKLHRFSPSRNNLRESWLLSEESPENATEVGPPTPYYNSSVLSELTASANQEFLAGVLANGENLKQAIVLLKIWLRQRRLKVPGHVVSMFVAHLVQSKRINNIMSSYQIVRNVWISLKTSEWDTKGMSVKKPPEGSPSLEEFLGHFPVVFLDATGYYNICWQMHRGTYQALKRESALAVEMLDNTSINSFIPLFMTPVTPLVQFDNILKCKDLQKIKEAVYSKTPKEARVNYGIDKLSLVTETIHTLLAKGLGDRVHLILQVVENDFSWPVKESVDKAKNSDYEEKLSFGFILNAENAMNPVMKGPSANLPEAEVFRSFWGDKSELRRFQDGAITEACVWRGGGAAERRGVTGEIVQYLLALKYGITKETFYVADQLDSILTCKAFADLGSVEEMSFEVIQAFDDLRRQLRSLADVPLDVSSVYGTSPVLSTSCPCPAPRARPPARPWRRHAACLLKQYGSPPVCPPYVGVTSAVVELGHSGKWPGDLQAFRALKAAFNLQISEQITKQYNLPTQPYPTHIDVLKSGYVFRLEIAHPKEITLLRKEVEGGVVKYRDTEESLNLQLNTVLMPRLRGALHGLQQTHSAFGPTACLFKRWLCCHLLDESHFPPTVAELLAAAIFLKPEPETAPLNPLIGFVRTLKLLVNTDWTKDMLVLNLTHEFSAEETSELERKFSTRDTSTPPYLHIVTPFDGDTPSVWSRQAPTKPVLCRAVALARSTIGYLEKALLEDNKEQVLSAFAPSLKGYDVFIHLHPSLVPHRSERVDQPRGKRTSEEPRSDQTTGEFGEVIPVAEFHPVRRYLQELRSAYSDFALFFHDTYGGDVIAVLWRPDIDEPKEFQVSTANALKPVTEGSQQYRVNKQAIAADFALLGQGLVKEVIVT